MINCLCSKYSLKGLMIDYILVNNKYKSSVKDVKVIPGEEIVNQHCLILMNMVLKKVRRKVKLRKKLKLWRLSESKVKDKFAEGANNKCDDNKAGFYPSTFVYSHFPQRFSFFNILLSSLSP